MLTMITLLSLIFTSFGVSPPMSLEDNVLFAFDKCKNLSVNLDKGQLLETYGEAMDLHCKKNAVNSQEMDCEFFESKTGKKIQEKKFRGGSHLGEAILESDEGEKLKFYLGKKYASFSSQKDFKLCIGFYLFEKEALKKKSI